MDLQRLLTFRTVATLMNFNQAAEILHYSQSTVSAQIKTLEEEIGIQLFKRIGKSIQLTEAGGKMVVYADKLLAIRDEAVAAVTGHQKVAGRLTLRMPQTMAIHYLPAIIADFQPRFPAVGLDVTSCALHSLEKELRIGQVDLAFLFADSISTENLESELLGIESLVVAAHPDHSLTTRKSAGLSDLEDQVLLLPKSDCGYRMEFEQALVMEGISPATTIEMNSIEAIKQAVLTGIGIALLPEIVIREEIKEGRIAKLRWEERMETGVLMIYHRDKYRSPATEMFMESVRRNMRYAPGPVIAAGP